MEKLKKDLFADPELESKNRKTAGACATAIIGGSVCLTQTPAGPDRLNDVPP